MNIDQYEDRMIRALEGDLSENEYNVLMEAIEKDDKLQSVWNEYRELYKGLDAIPQDIPSPLVKERFDIWLKGQTNEKPRIVDIAPKSMRQGPFIVWRKWAGAAAILICVFGFWKMFEHNKNVESTLADVSLHVKELMEQQSSTARIKAIRVNYNPNSVSVDEKMIQVLIDVLYNDESSNVRLASVETLAQFMDQEVVREALISRLATEYDGGVKLSIITSLAQQQDEKLKTTLENIVNDDSQEKFVIDEAHMQLIRFDKIDI